MIGSVATAGHGLFLINEQFRQIIRKRQKISDYNINYRLAKILI